MQLTINYQVVATQTFFIFTPKIGEDGPILTNIFQRGDSTTWRIIPVSKWLETMVSKSPKWGYSPYKWPFHGL